MRWMNNSSHLKLHLYVLHTWHHLVSFSLQDSVDLHPLRSHQSLRLPHLHPVCLILCERARCHFEHPDTRDPILQDKKPATNKYLQNQSIRGAGKEEMWTLLPTGIIGWWSSSWHSTSFCHILFLDSISSYFVIELLRDGEGVTDIITFQKVSHFCLLVLFFPLGYIEFACKYGAIVPVLSNPHTVLMVSSDEIVIWEKPILDESWEAENEDQRSILFSYYGFHISYC